MKQRLGTNLRTVMGGPAGGGRERPRDSRTGGPWRCSCLCLSGPPCQPPYWVCVAEVPRCCPDQVVGRADLGSGSGASCIHPILRKRPRHGLWLPHLRLFLTFLPVRVQLLPPPQCL